MNKVFEISLSARDYECDLQGVVNNAVYMNYLEHARHEFLKSRDVNFADLAHQGINLVVVRAELDYKGSLRGGDEFLVRTRCRRVSRLKLAFLQEIIKKDDQKLMLKAVVTGAAVNDQGKPMYFQELERMLGLDEEG